MASPQVAGLTACYIDRDASTFGTTFTKANQESAKVFLQGDGDIDSAITDWGDGLTNLNRSYQPYQDYTITWSTGAGALSSISEEANNSFDLSATFRNAASEQLHTVTHTIQSGSIPSGMTLDSAGLLDGAPDSSSSGTYNFTVRSDNGFEYEDRAYSLTVNEASVNMTITGGVIIDSGVTFG